MCSSDLYHLLFLDSPMPSAEALSEMVERLRSVLFPGFFQESYVTPQNMAYFTGSKLEQVRRELIRQVERGFCFFCPKDEDACSRECTDRAERIAGEFLKTLPHIRHMLATDVQAAFAECSVFRSIPTKKRQLLCMRLFKKCLLQLL